MEASATWFGSALLRRLNHLFHPPKESATPSSEGNGPSDLIRHYDHPLSSAAMAQPAKEVHNRNPAIGFVFSKLAQRHLRRALESAFGFVFTKLKVRAAPPNRKVTGDATLGSSRSKANRPLGSYFQTCPMALVLGTRTRVGFVFTSRRRPPGLGSLRKMDPLAISRFAKNAFSSPFHERGARWTSCQRRSQIITGILLLANFSGRHSVGQREPCSQHQSRAPETSLHRWNAQVERVCRLFLA